MVQSDPARARLVASIEAATIPRPAGSALPAARFAVELAADQSRTDVTNDIVAALAAYDPTVAPLSALEHRALTVTLGNRVFLQQPETMFEAGYAMADAFALAQAEPEVLTDVMPCPDPARAGPREESIDDFPPGCWMPQAPDLDGNRRWALAKIRLPEAWSLSMQAGQPGRGEGIIVAQPDTGVAAHAELDRARRVASRNLVEGGEDPTDPLNYFGNPGHGTGTGSVVVGIESAEMSGAAPLAFHMPIRAIEAVERLSQISVAQAIDFAVGRNAHVISMSLGGIPSFALHRALRRAVAADVIVIAAAGNCVGLVVWPARYEECIAVAGTNLADGAWQGTCHGPDVTIAAPAENVYRAHVELKSGAVVGDVGQGQGTSFATALIAGVAACWLAHHGRANVITAAHARGETVQALFHRLLAATARRPEGWDSSGMGAGVVDAHRLLVADFDVGRERETAAALGAAPPEAAVQRFLLEAAGIDAATAPIDLKRYGPEVALALLTRRKGEGPARRGLAAEAAAAAASTSAPLSAALHTSLPVALALAVALGHAGAVP
jgi:serine protease